MPSLIGKPGQDSTHSAEEMPGRARRANSSRGVGDAEAVQPAARQDAARQGAVYEFEEFRLDPANRLLCRNGKEVVLPGRGFDVLLMLVRRPRALLTKEELLASIWNGSFVEEANLTVAISTVRRALQEDPHQRRYIQTVARRGYRFVAEVRAIRNQDEENVAWAAAASGGESATVESPAVGELRTRHSSVAGDEAADAPQPGVVQPSPVSENAGLVEDLAVVSRTHGAAEASRPRKPLLPTALIVGLLIALAVGFGVVLKPGQPIRTLAVLPFTMSGSDGSAEEYVLLGLTDALITRLEGVLVVRPTSSVLLYSEGTQVDAVAAGRTQGVDAVLTGVLEKGVAGTSLRLHLIRVQDGFTLWQDSFHAGPGDLPQLEQDAGEAAAKALGRLSPGRAPGSRITPVKETVSQRANDPAYQLYLRGRYFWNRRTVDGLRKSVECFRQAIGADPNYAPAYAGLADSYALLASFSVEPGRSADADARSAALSAIHLDPTLAEPHASLGMIYFFTDWNLRAAQTEFERAIALDPNYATAHHWYALDLAAMGLEAQALYEIRLAQKLDPLSLIIGTNVGWIEYLGHDYADARRDLNRVLELDPNFVRARTRLGMVELTTGDNSSAIRDLTQALALSGDEDPWVEGLLGDAQARSGDRAGAQRTLAKLRARSAKEYVPPISRALVLLALGEKDQAIVALGQAVEDHSTAMVYARVDPLLDSVRGDAGFEGLLRPIRR